jgi:MFS family permease
MKNKYSFTAIGCYINYFVFGMAYIMIAQNMSFLTEQFHTDKAGISFIISAFGLGRLLSLYLGGVWSDKIGRKPFIVAGCLLFAVFLIGIPLSPNYVMAIVFAFCGGLGNAFLDAGTYPTLMEVFPKTAGSATVALKAFISFGSALLPLLIAFFIQHHIFYGMSFFIPAIIFLVSGFMLVRAKFPNHKASTDNKESGPPVVFYSKPNFMIEGVAIIVIGFTAPALLYLMNIWIPTYGQEMIGMPLVDSLKLMSYYSWGALLSVISLAFLVRKTIRPVTIVLVYPIFSFLSILALLTFKTPVFAMISAFLIGFFLAGVLQLGLTVLCEFFWDRKGSVTGIMYTATGLATTLIPMVSGFITRYVDIHGVFVFALLVNFIGILAAGVVFFQYRKLTSFKQQQLAA